MDEPPTRAPFVTGRDGSWRPIGLARRTGAVVLVLAIGPLGLAPASAGQGAGPSPLSCLDRPAKRIAVSSPLGDAPLELTPEPGSVLDLRRITLATEPPRNPLVISRADGDVCVVGPTVLGRADRAASWSKIKRNHDGDGVRFAHARGAFTLEGARIENVEDAVAPPKDPETSRDARFTIRGVYACYIRDDFIENDAALGGEISDTLVDGAHVFISARPGQGFEGGFPRATMRVRDTLVRLDCKPDERADGQDTAATEGWAGGACGVGKSLGMPFKWSGASRELHLDIADTIIRVDAAGRNGRRSMNFPRGDYSNVTLVWLGTGDYPGALPRSGVTVTTDAAVWDEARADWLRRHGYTSGETCATR